MSCGYATALVERMQDAALYWAAVLNQTGWERWSIQQSVHSPNVGAAEGTSRDSLCLLLSSCRLHCFCPFMPLSYLPLQRTTAQRRTGEHSPHLISEQQMSCAGLESWLGPVSSPKLGKRIPVTRYPILKYSCPK